jgi:hypothetical protein
MPQVRTNMTSAAKRFRLAGALVFGWLAVVVMTLVTPPLRVDAAEPEPLPTGIPAPTTPLTHAQVHADWPPLPLELLAGEEGESAGSAESPQATDSLCDLYTGQRVAYQKYTRAGRWDIYLRQCYQPLDPFIVSTTAYELMPDLNDGATRLLFVRATEKENSEEIYVTETYQHGATRLTQNQTLTRSRPGSPSPRILSLRRIGVAMPTSFGHPAEAARRRRWSLRRCTRCFPTCRSTAAT